MYNQFMADVEERKLADIKGSPRNPRRISKHDFEHLKTSILKFGDLSGVVRNRRTDQLVGGHQRIEAFRELKAPKIVITETLAAPNSVGTVAYGYVVLGDERYAYREVDWAVEFEEAANVAANRIQGEWDQEALAQIIYEMTDELRGLTGETEDEIAKLLSLVGGDEDDVTLPEGDKPGYEQMTFTLTTEQADTMRRAIESAKSLEDFKDQENENSNGNALYFMASKYLGQDPHAARSAAIAAVPPGTGTPTNTGPSTTTATVPPAVPAPTTADVPEFE